MQKKTTLVLILCFICLGKAQDSIQTINPKSGFKYQKLILPVALVTVGSIIKSPAIQLNMQRDIRNAFGQDFHTKIDDYLQFIPATQLFAGDYLGFKSAHSTRQKLRNIFISKALVIGITVAVKNITKDLRPDGSAYNSFPSGHTTAGFSNATLLFHEYKDSNIWYASSGYLFATATGVLRIANNRHWSGDVVAGAGLGIAIGTIVNYWQPLSNSNQKSKKITFAPYPVIGNQNYGIGLLCELK